MEAIIPEPTLSGREPGARVTNSALEVCKSDPNPIGFRNKNIDFGSDRIGKLFRSRIGSDFVIGRRSLFQPVIRLCISCFLFNLTKHFHFH